jgi:hypothetical protein
MILSAGLFMPATVGEILLRRAFFVSRKNLKKVF